MCHNVVLASAQNSSFRQTQKKKKKKTDAKDQKICAPKEIISQTCNVFEDKTTKYSTV